MFELRVSELWAGLGLKRRFLGFFMLTSVLPLLLFSFLFMHKTIGLIGERNEELLETGILLSQEMIIGELDRVELAASQLANLAIGDEFYQAVEEGKTKPLERILSQYMAGKNSDLLILLDKTGQLVAISDANNQSLPTKDVPASLKRLLTAAQKGNVLSGIEQVANSNNQANPIGQTEQKLMLVSAVPVYSLKKPNRIIGTLLLGKAMSRLARHPDFIHLPNGLWLTVLKREGHRVLPVISSQLFADVEKPLPDDQLLRASKEEKLLSLPIHGIAYSSLVRQITNPRGENIGYMMVSIPTQSLNDLLNQNIYYIVLCLIAGIGMVTALGTWFNRTFITPMNDLSRVAEVVAEGNLAARVDAEIEYEDMRRTLRNFNQMLSQLEEKEHLRKMFVSTLTHDLRTPLISQQRVVQFLKSAAQAELNPQATGLLDGLADSNQHLLKMVNQLLETYQYDAGQITLSVESTRLAPLVDACFLEVRGMAAEKDIALLNAVPNDLELRVDPDQFKRVLMNLIGNSIENIDTGDHIRVSAQRTGNGVDVQVADNGPGIEPELLPHLFERYPSQYGRRQKIGSGLGLYICKMIVELHGGTIAVDSRLEENTVFSIHVPDRFPDHFLETLRPEKE
jgi:signal transduction histidine kinase